MDKNNMADVNERVMKGEKVNCPNCGELLIYQKLESGLHPSIICPSGDYNVRINVGKSDILERLDLIKPKRK